MTMRVTRAAFLSIGALAFAVTPALSQDLPGYQGPSISELRGEWAVSMRGFAERSVQDWVNLLDRGEWESLAAFFTDRAVFSDASGDQATGREAIAELLRALPERTEPEAQVLSVSAGNRLIHATGRLRYYENGEDRLVGFSLLLETHRERWMYRMMSMYPDPQLARVMMPAVAIRPNRTAVHPPRRTNTRFVAEPMALSALENASAGYQASLGAGAAVGVEMDRVIEARAYAFRQSEGPAQEIVSLGGELRGYVFSVGRARPYLFAGIERFSGAAAPDTAWVPAAGGGVAVGVVPGIDLHLSFRNSFISDADGASSSGWLTEKRSRKGMVSLGFSFAAGQSRPWTDSPPSPIQVAAEATELPYVVPVISRWSTALMEGRGAEIAAIQLADGPVILPRAQVAPSGDKRADFLTQRIGPTAAAMDDLRVSGAVGYLDLDLDHPSFDRAFLVLTRQQQDWSVHTVIFH